MPAKPLPRITAWSYSRWSDYEKCPRKAKYKHVDRIPDGGSPAMERGTAIHKMAENYLNFTDKTLSKELSLFKKEFTTLKSKTPRVEDQWAFDKSWGKVTWFDKTAWLRIKVDAWALPRPQTMDVIDHKTGKRYPGNDLQLSLYALGGFFHQPEVTKINAKLWYLDIGEEVKAEFKIKDKPALQKDWTARVKPMLTDTRFAAKPGNHCSFCPYRKSNGGPCEF